MALDYLVTYANTPLCLDFARVIRLAHDHAEQEDPKNLFPKKHQPETDLTDELERLLSPKFLQDYVPSSAYPGRNLGAIAHRWQPGGRRAPPDLRLGDFWWPVGATRWSVFKCLATSSQVAKMLAATQGSNPQSFVFQVNPFLPGHGDNDTRPYTLQTRLSMLPARCFGEHGAPPATALDGLYLVTLVDERYYWQFAPVSLHVRPETQWADLIAQLASALNVTIRTSNIQGAYTQPEQDSHLWTNLENAGVLLDAIAFNIGRKVVRNLDGTYDLLTGAESQARVLANRGNAQQVVRSAGGDIFQSGPSLLKVGVLSQSRNAVTPDLIQITFPKYVVGDDPVPHFVNSRHRPQRPSCWYEESYGDVHTVNILLANSGPNGILPGPLVTPPTNILSGNVSTHAIHSTAKALYSGEIQASGPTPTPLNASGLTALAVQLANDYWSAQSLAALDEVYPGSLAWSPEGIHDLLWTFSAKIRQGCTRVMRSEWNQVVREMQHATPPQSGINTNTPRGVGGPAVAQTHRDGQAFFSGHVVTTIYGSGLTVDLSGFGTVLGSGDLTALFKAVDYFPTQNRWRGQIDNEVMLFEGTSGGLSSGGALGINSGALAVTIVYRGIDGTRVAQHQSGVGVVQLLPNTQYGVNLVSDEKMQFSYPADWTSGGITGVRRVPQTQTVQVLATLPANINSVFLWSGQVDVHDPSLQSGSQFPGKELIWVAERNGNFLASGKHYDGQFTGYSASGAVAPIYQVNDDLGTLSNRIWALVGGLQMDSPCGRPSYSAIQISPGLHGTFVNTANGLTWHADNGPVGPGQNILYERNDMFLPVAEPVVAQVYKSFLRADGTQEWEMEFERRYFPATIHNPSGGPGPYNWDENYPPGGAPPTPRKSPPCKQAIEGNGFTVPDNSTVQMFEYFGGPGNSAAKVYYFWYEAPADIDVVDATGNPITNINIYIGIAGPTYIFILNGVPVNCVMLPSSCWSCSLATIYCGSGSSSSSSSSSGGGGGGSGSSGSSGGGGGGQTCGCANMPATIHATLTDTSGFGGNCSALNGLVLTMVQNPGPGLSWTGDTTINGVDFNLTLVCSGGLDPNNYSLTGGCGGQALTGGNTISSADCSIPQVLFTNMGTNACTLCFGPNASFSVKITP